MTISQTLARFVAATDGRRLGEREISGAKEAISDCIGCAIAGSHTDVGEIVRCVADASSPEGAATVIGSARRISAQAAALANGAAAHALDYDDILWTLYGHPSVTMVPATLAAAETVGASGREIITAFAIGVEIAGKLGRWVNPLHYEHGWHATATIGVLGATAAVAKLYRLDEQQIVMALGIAASEACGVRQNFGSMTKPFHAGNAARGAVLAVELARAGMTSSARAFEGEFGWLDTLNARTSPTAEALEAVLGRPWELVEPGIVLKRYPACGGTHCALDALIALKNEHGFAADQVESIHCAAHPLAKKVLLHPRPRTGLEGKFSMEYCLAVAAIEGRAGRRHFDAPWVTDPRVAALLPRIAFDTRDDLAETVSADAVPAEVTVRVGGKTLRYKVTVPSGDPRNPMTAPQRREKFLDCTDGIVAADRADRLWADLERLDGLPDVTPLMAALRGAFAPPVARAEAVGV